jgi:hypothetical protein
MKPAVLAGAFVGVFLVGIGAGALLTRPSANQGPDYRPNPGTAPGNTGPMGAPEIPLVAGGSTTGTRPNGTTPANPTNTSTKPPANGTKTPEGVEIRESANGMTQPLANDARKPPPLTPGSLAEAERIKRELQDNPDGNGATTSLVYDFESPEEAAAWEERRRETWQRRLQREMDIKLKTMREKVGIDEGQARELAAIMTAENRERQRLVDLLTNKQISRTTFDEQVQANVEGARKKLQGLLSAEQYTAYQALDPREQVLRDDLK